MGVGNLHIGENQGPAQIFGHNPAIQQYAQMLQQRKAKEDADNKYLAEQLASVKPDGLRNDADKGQFWDGYAKVKQQAIDAENIKDPRKKTMEIANVRQKMMDLNAYVDESKKQAARENQFAQSYMTNPTAFSNEAIATHRKGIEAAVNSPDAVKDYTTLARQVDANKIEKEWKDEAKEMLGTQRWETPFLTNMKIAGRNDTFIQNHRSVPTSELYERALHKAASQSDFDHYLQQAFPEQYKSGGRTLAAKTFVDQQGPVAEYPKPDPKTPLAPRTNIYVSGGQPIPLAIPAENAEGKQIGVFTSPNYLAINKQGINMAGTPSINMQTLQPEQPLKSSSKYNLVGLTPAPVLNKDLYVGNKKIPKGSLSQGNYAKAHPEDVTWKDMAHVQEDYPADDEHAKPYTVDHLVDAKLLPHSITGTKAWQSQVANYKSYKGQQTDGSPNKPIKSYQHTQKAKDSKGNIVTLGYKDGKWYNTETNQPVQ